MTSQARTQTRRQQRGFTLVETMLVTTVIGALSAFALPIYQDYTARAQLTEVLTGMSAMKHQIAENVTVSGAISNDLSAPFGADSTSVAAVAVYRYENCPDQGGVEVQLSNQMGSKLSGKRLRLSMSDNGQWTCGHGAGDAIDNSLLPRACRNVVATSPAGCGSAEFTDLTASSVAANNNSFGDADWSSGYGTGNSGLDSDDDLGTAEADEWLASADETTLEWEQAAPTTASTFDYSSSGGSVSTGSAAPAASGGASVSSTEEQGCDNELEGATETGSNDALLTADCAAA